MTQQNTFVETSSANETIMLPTQISWTPGTKLEEIERAAIVQTLLFRNGNRTHAARDLGIGLRTLQRKIKAYAGI